MPAQEPVTFTAKLGASAQGVMPCGTLVDGADHVAVCSDRTGAAPADHTSTVIHSLDGTVVATLNGHPVVAMPRGFVNAHDAIDYGQQSSITAWTPEASNTLITGAIIPMRESDWCSWDVAPDGRIVTACWTQTSGSRWRLYDDALRPLDAGHATDDHAAIRGIDRNGLAVVTTPAGARWHDLDGAPVSASIEGGFSGGQRLIGGGFVTEAGILSSGSTAYGPRPAWMPAAPLAIVRGGKGYASVVLQDPKSCVQRVEVRAVDGTICSTVDVRGENDCTSARLTVGARGSLSDFGDEQTCADLICARKVRVWPRLLE